MPLGKSSTPKDEAPNPKEIPSPKFKIQNRGEEVTASIRAARRSRLTLPHAIQREWPSHFVSNSGL
jgi:hypothetical protein